MRKNRILPLILLFIFHSIQIFGQTENLRKNNQAELEKILGKCAEYCEKLTHSVLDFVCREKITEEITNIDPRRSEVLEELSSSTSTRSSVNREGSELNTYVYDYQMIRKDNIITNRRILLRENGNKKHEEDAQLKIKRFKHQNILFGPIALLDIQWQPFYDYKIIRREKVKRDNVVVIEATPKDTNTSENPYGKVWIREDDFSIVKIEWDQRSLPNLDLFEQDAKNFRARPEIKFNVEYGFEKNVLFAIRMEHKNKYTFEISITSENATLGFRPDTITYSIEAKDINGHKKAISGKFKIERV